MTELAATTNIEAWSERMLRKRKSLFLVMFAEMVAVSAEACYGWLNAIREGQLAWLPDPPPIDVWLAMYDDSEQVRNVVLDSVFPFVDDDGSRLIRDSLDGLREDVAKLIAMSDKDRRTAVESAIELLQEHWQDVQACIGELYELHLKALRDDLDWGDDESTFQRVFAKAEVLFFLQVSLPCWMEYGTSPGVLFRQARSGDDDAFCKLIRIDKRVLRDPVLGDRHDVLAKCRQSVEFSDLAQAHAGNPQRPLSRRKVKCALAGLIRQLSLLLNQRLTHSELRDLFDAVARDAVVARLRDEDLQPGDDAFRKMVQLDQKHWSFDEWEIL